jgi:hypothetical protein
MPRQETIVVREKVKMRQLMPRQDKKDDSTDDDSARGYAVRVLSLMGLKLVVRVYDLEPKGIGRRHGTETCSIDGQREIWEEESGEGEAREYRQDATETVDLFGS